MICHIESSRDHDLVVTPFGRLAIAKCLYQSRGVSSEEFGAAVLAAHQKAWQRGEVDFVCTADELGRGYD